MTIREEKPFQRLRQAARSRGYRYFRVWQADGRLKHQLLGETESVTFWSEAEVFQWLTERGYRPRGAYQQEES